MSAILVPIRGPELQIVVDAVTAARPGGIDVRIEAPLREVGGVLSGTAESLGDFCEFILCRFGEEVSQTDYSQLCDVAERCCVSTSISERAK